MGEFFTKSSGHPGFKCWDFIFHGPPNFTKIVILGLKTNHLATLDARLFCKYAPLVNVASLKIFFAKIVVFGKPLMQK
jgi:hypothetical protein